MVAVGSLPPARPVPASRLQGWRSRHPEWWLYVGAALGWAVLVLLDVVRSRSPSPASAALASGHAGHLGPIGSGPAASGVGSPPVTIGEMAGHGLAALAMVAVMAPLVAANVRFAALRSPRRNRRAVALAVAWGWVSVWIIGGAVVGTLAGLAVGLVGAPASAVLATVVAVAWQWLRLKRKSLGRCHRVCAPPLAPGRSRPVCRRYGRLLGLNCVVSCAPMMALMVVAGHAVLVAAPLTGIALYERRRRPHHDPARWGTSVALGVVGGVAWLVVTFGVA